MNHTTYRYERATRGQRTAQVKGMMAAVVNMGLGATSAVALMLGVQWIEEGYGLHPIIAGSGAMMLTTLGVLIGGHFNGGH